MVETVKGEWDLSEPVRNAPCFCLLKRKTVLERRREEENRVEEEINERWDSSER